MYLELGIADFKKQYRQRHCDELLFEHLTAAAQEAVAKAGRGIFCTGGICVAIYPP